MIELSKKYKRLLIRDYVDFDFDYMHFDHIYLVDQYLSLKVIHIDY